MTGLEVMAQSTCHRITSSNRSFDIPGLIAAAPWQFTADELGLGEDINVRSAFPIRVVAQVSCCSEFSRMGFAVQAGIEVAVLTVDLIKRRVIYVSKCQ